MSAVKAILARAAQFGRPQRGGDSPVKATIAAGTERIGVQGRPRYPDVSVDTLARAHRRNELVFACVRAKGNALAKPRLIVESRTTSETYEEVLGHPLRRLLLRPNDQMDTAAFWRTLVVSRDIYGRFVCEKLLSPAGATVGLNPLDPRQVRPIVETGESRQQVVVGYEWRDGATRVPFRRDELLIWEPLSWADPPAAEVALGSVDSDSAQTDYVRAFFNNAGVPSGVLSLKRANVQQAEVDRIKARWRQGYGRIGGNQHDIAVLDEGAAYQKIGSALDELESETVRGVSESRIAMAFGVPPLIVYAYVGLLRATYSNLKEAYAGFWDLTIDPLLGDIAAWLTMTLLEEMEGRDRVLAEAVRLRWDVSQVAALQDDEDAKHARARANFQAGGILLNEFREIIGLDRDPAGDVYLRSLTAQEVPWDAPIEMALITANGETRADPYVHPRRMLRAGAQAMKAASTQPIQRRLEAQLAAYLEAEYARAAQAIREEG